ncbi:MAG: YajQ family cyclic di-GMP-binding protein [Bacteroidia bacterium]
MASFDIVSKIDAQTLDNAINSARKEIFGRFDFKGTKSTIELDKKNYALTIVTEDEMRLNSIIDIIRTRMMKQSLDPRCIDEGKEHYASGNMVRKDVKVRQGIDKDTARDLIKAIKDSKLKVTAQLMDDQVRVTAKKIDDLQAVIALVRRGEFDLPFQFTNMKA